MSQTPLSINVDVVDILKEINGKLDRIQQETNTKLDRIQQETNTKLDRIQQETNTKLDRIEKDLSELKTDVKVLNEKVDGQGKRLDKLESTQTNQLWALIVLLAGAIVTGIIAALRLSFAPRI